MKIHSLSAFIIDANITFMHPGFESIERPSMLLFLPFTLTLCIRFVVFASLLCNYSGEVSGFQVDTADSASCWRFQLLLINYSRFSSLLRGEQSKGASSVLEIITRCSGSTLRAEMGLDLCVAFYYSSR